MYVHVGLIRYIMYVLLVVKLKIDAEWYLYRTSGLQFRCLHVYIQNYL